MSLGDPRPLTEARRVADALVAELAPACARIEIAGSIRRCRPLVSDIEIVAIPLYREEARPGPPQASLFAPAPDWNPPPPLSVNRAWEALDGLGESRVLPLKPGGVPGEVDGKWQEKRLAGSRQFKLWLPVARMQVDVFMPDVERWGLIYTIRTGSALFSEALVTHWTKYSGGGHAKEGRLVDASGRKLGTPEEADVFCALGLKFTPPPARVDAGSLVRL